MERVEGPSRHGKKTWVHAGCEQLAHQTHTSFDPVMRIGKPLEHLQAALRAAQATGDLKEQISTIGRQLGYFGYLTYDAIVWVCSVNVRVSHCPFLVDRASHV